MEMASAFTLNVRLDNIAIITIDVPGEKMNTLKAEFGNQVRGLIPWPTAVTELGGNRCKVFSTSVLDATTSAAPGTILAAGKEGIQVACGGGTVLRIDELQADGGKRMKAADYLRGHPIPVG